MTSFKLNSHVSGVKSLANASKLNVGTNIDTIETQLWSYALPASTLSADGMAIRISAQLTYASNANTKTTKVYFGGTPLTANPTTTAPKDGAHSFQVVIIRRSASSQYMYFANNAVSGITQSLAITASPIENTATGITLKITGQNGTASRNDIVVQNVRVESCTITTGMGFEDQAIAPPASLLPDGSAGAPSLAFANNPTSGFLNVGGAPGISVLGTQRFFVATNASGLTSNTTFGWSSSTSNPQLLDTILAREAANTLALVNGTNPQTLRIYNTQTDASNYERGTLDWVTRSGFMTIGTQSAGTGAGKPVQFIAAGGEYFDLSGSIINIAVPIKFLTDNGSDIGLIGANRPRNYFGAGTVQVGVFTVATLATCNTAAKGTHSFVSDANATTFLSTVAGGGANNVPVVCNGTNWVIG